MLRGVCTGGSSDISAAVVTLTLPPEAVEGDSLIVVSTTNIAGSTISITDATQLQASDDPHSNNNGFLFHKVLTASDISGTTIDVGCTQSGHLCACGAVYYGLNATTPISSSAYVSIVGSSGSTPSITTTTDNSDVIVGATARVTAPTQSVTQFPAGWTKDVNTIESYNSGANESVAVGHLDTPGPAGTYGPITISTSPVAEDINLYIIATNAALAVSEGTASDSWVGTASATGSAPAPAESQGTVTSSWLAVASATGVQPNAVATGTVTDSWPAVASATGSNVNIPTGTGTTVWAPVGSATGQTPDVPVPTGIAVTSWTAQGSVTGVAASVFSGTATTSWHAVARAVSSGAVQASPGPIGLGWHFHLYKVNGDGTQELLAPDIPVSEAQVTPTLSGTDTITGQIKPEVARLVGLVVPWQSFIVAEYKSTPSENGTIFACCIIDEADIDDSAAQSFTSVGWFGYLQDMPYLSRYSKVQIDPLDVARDMWTYVQSFDGGDIGLILDDTTSPIRIGTDKEHVEFTTQEGEAVEFDAGPYTLDWWKTDDLSQDFTTLATDTPFDFYEEHLWSGPGSDDIEHHLRLRYPRAGTRRHDLRFHVGENVVQVPSVTYAGDEYASEVFMLGAGEGSKQRHAYATGTRNGRLRRIAVVDDTSLDTKTKVQAAADAEVKWRTGSVDISEVVVIDHPNAVFGSWAEGDDIHVTSDDLPWAGEIDLWVRVLSSEYDVDAGTCTLSVARADRTNRD